MLRQFPALSPVALKSKAEEIDFAVDYLADYVVEDLDWAARQDIDAIVGIDKGVIAKAKNPYWLAALSYNRGRPEALQALGHPRGCRHADLIVGAWARIDDRSGTDSTTVRAPRYPVEVEDDPRRLAMGDLGPGVEALQRLLNDRLNPSPSLKADGNFGPATRDALMRRRR